MTTIMLEELKLRVTHLLAAVCCVGLSCYYLCFFELFVLTITPLDNVCFLDLTEAFSVTIKVLLFFTTLFIAPAVCFHGWGFVSPGLIIITTGTQIPSLARSPVLWLLVVSLISSHVLTHLLCVWCLGYSLSAEGLVLLQYLPLMSGFVWLKLKCFLCVAAGCLLAGAVPLPGFKLRRWFYSGAVLLGAFLAGPGAPQFILSLCIILLCELWFFSSYLQAKRTTTYLLFATRRNHQAPFHPCCCCCSNIQPNYSVGKSKTQ